MPFSQNIMSHWLRTATSDQRKQLAKAAKTSFAHLQHIASGRRGVTAELAQRLSAASLTLPKALRLDARALCKACSTCPLARKKAA